MPGEEVTELQRRRRGPLRLLFVAEAPPVPWVWGRARPRRQSESLLRGLPGAAVSGVPRVRRAARAPLPLRAPPASPGADGTLRRRQRAGPPRPLPPAPGAR